MAAQWWVWVLAVAGMLAALLALLFVIGLVRDRRAGAGRHAATRPTRDSFRKGAEDEPPPPKKRAAIVVNPTKVSSVAAFEAQVTSVMTEAGWDAPLILETTAEDPGSGQARAALAANVDLICVVGGDGTVRFVAEAMSGTTTPLGLLPAGTGNLLARNLRVPAESLDEALAVAMTGRNRHIDVGWVTLDPLLDHVTLTGPADEEFADHEQPDHEQADNEQAGDEPTNAEGPGAEIQGEELDTGADESMVAGEEPGTHGIPAQEHPDQPAEADRPDDGDAPRRHAFLVMAGLGFDAAIMDDTSDELKATIGWPAYFSGGMRNLLRRRFHTTLVLDDAEPQHFRTRTVLAGNCGRLTGGIVLMPDAAVDDGLLNLVVISPKGLGGWAAVAAHVLTQRGSNHARLDRFSAARAHVTVDEAQAVQADGDVLGEARSLLLEIAPQSLIVRSADRPDLRMPPQTRVVLSCGGPPRNRPPRHS